MRMSRRAPGGADRRDDGSAMIMTLMVMVLVGAVATAVALVAIRNVQSASLARSAGVAVDAANAGISEGVSYLRTNGLVAVETCGASATADPKDSGFAAFDLGSQQCVRGLSDSKVRPVSGKPYTVLIAARSDYSARTGGYYQVVARGTGPERASRIVSADVAAEGSGFGQGALQGNTINLSGQVPITGQSLFATGCVSNRTHLTLTGTDAYGLPAAVHSESIITDSNNCSGDPNDRKADHYSSPCSSNAMLAYDQDAGGGPLAANSPCRPANAGHYYDNGSKLGPGDLQKVYGISFPALTPEDVESLRATATAQGNLRTTGGAVTPKGSQAVLFYQMHGGSVDLSQVSGFSYDPADYVANACPNRSLVVVIEGASMTWNTNSVPPLVASIFLVTPGKTFDIKGGGIVGSVYADTISLTGATAVSAVAQNCSNQHPSPSLLKFTITSYRELDS